jgi:hypothetical protein
LTAREQDNADIDALAARLAGRPLDDLDTIEWLWNEGKRLVDAGRAGSAALQVNTAHLVARVPLLVARVRQAETPTVGDLINARARAGAARVEAEQTAERARAALKHAHGRDRIAAARETFAAASQRLTLAANAYEAARTAEAAGGNQ